MLVQPRVLVLRSAGGFDAGEMFAVSAAIDKGTFSSAMDDAEVFKDPRLGIPTRVLLALPPEEFKAESVAPAGGDWGERFASVIG